MFNLKITEKGKTLRLLGILIIAIALMSIAVEQADAATKSVKIKSVPPAGKVIGESYKKISIGKYDKGFFLDMQGATTGKSGKIIKRDCTQDFYLETKTAKMDKITIKYWKKVGKKKKYFTKTYYPIVQQSIYNKNKIAYSLGLGQRNWKAHIERSWNPVKLTIHYKRTPSLKAHLKYYNSTSMAKLNKIGSATDGFRMALTGKIVNRTEYISTLEDIYHYNHKLNFGYGTTDNDIFNFFEKGTPLKYLSEKCTCRVW